MAIRSPSRTPAFARFAAIAAVLLSELRVGDRARRIPVRNLLRPLLRMPIEKLSRSAQSSLRAASFASRQIILNPPLMLIVCPVIQLPASEASSATIGATSEGWPRRRIGIGLDQLLAVSLDPCLVVRGLDQSERDRIGRHARTAPFARERLHQRDGAGARRGGKRQPGFADARGVSHDRDDAPAARSFQQGARAVATIERAVQAGIDLLAPVLRAAFAEALPEHQAGIVDKDVEPAEVALDVRDELLDYASIRDVGLIGFRLASGPSWISATTASASAFEP